MFLVDFKVPHYITKKSSTLALIIWVALFALIFINVFEPFGSRMWYGDVNDTVYFVFSSLVVLAGVLVLTVSRLVMYHYTKRHEINILTYIVWIGVELLVMSFFYALFPVWILDIGHPLLEIWKSSAKYCSLVLLIPYTVSWLYLALREKEITLKRMLESPSMATPSHEPFTFADEKGNIQLSVTPDNLFYIEGADNYISIFYLNKGKLNEFMLRNTLKHVEESFVGRNLVRCHRSYIVNLDKVKIIRKSENGMSIDFDHEELPNIPISKTFSNAVFNHFYKQ